MLIFLIWGNDFFAMIPKSQIAREQIDKLDFIKVKVKAFCAFKVHQQESENTNHRMRKNIIYL